MTSSLSPADQATADEINRLACKRTALTAIDEATDIISEDMHELIEMLGQIADKEIVLSSDELSSAKQSLAIMRGVVEVLEHVTAENKDR